MELEGTGIAFNCRWWGNKKLNPLLHHFIELFIFYTKSKLFSWNIISVNFTIPRMRRYLYSNSFIRLYNVHCTGTVHM